MKKISTKLSTEKGKIADEPLLYAASLRIGNYYNSVKFKQPVKCHLTDLYELCFLSDGATDDPPINEIFEPIPLTKDWLEKFGFEKINPNNDFYSIDILNAWTKLYIDINRHGGEISISGHGSVVKQLKFIHQLQNLYYALTGNELSLSGI